MSLCLSVSETQDSPQGDPNLQLWDVESGQLIKALYQKKVDSWWVRTSSDWLCVIGSL